MTDVSGQWFYKMFGQDFGPVTFDELKVLAEFGTISADDEVCQGDSGDWLHAGAVPGLKFDVNSSVVISSTAVEKEPFVATAPAVTEAEDWFCMADGQELGPVSFDELAAIVSNGHLGTDDEVKLGASGEWRRIGFIGRLEHVLCHEIPSHEHPQPAPSASEAAESTPSNTTAEPPKAQTADAATAVPIAAVPAVVPPISAAPTAVAIASATTLPSTSSAPPAASKYVFNESELEWVKAEAGYAANERVARQLIAWAFSPTYNPQWWAVIGGAEAGPVDFATIFEWLVSGRMQPAEFVRNGAYGQYGPVGNLPSVFSAAIIMKLANGEHTQAKARAVRDGVAIAARPVFTAAATITPLSKVSTSAPEVSKLQVIAGTLPDTPTLDAAVQSTPLPTPATSIDEERPNAASKPSSSNEGGSSSTARSSRTPYSKGRSARSKSKPFRVQHKSLFDGEAFSRLREKLEPYKSSGIIAAAVIVLLVFSWPYLPESSAGDVRRYRDLKKILEELRELRSKDSSNFTEIKTKAVKVSGETVMALEKSSTVRYPAKKLLLQAARDEFPRLIYGDLKIETAAEKKLQERLAEVAKVLRIK